MLERAAEAEAAREYYARYLARGTAPPAERAEIEARMRELDALLARQKAQVKAVPPSSDALTEEARAFFERGLKLFARKRFEAALAAFAAARRFAQLPELTYNLALTCERLGRTAEAVDYYRAYLREAENAGDRDRVAAHVQALRQQNAPEPAR